jgi:hypothetical protein
LLERSNQRNGNAGWSPRPLHELERDLQVLYGLPIDASAKRSGLATVAKGLTSGDLALAQVAAVLLRFPDPPLVKDGSGWPSPELAVVLRESGLIKWYWNSDDDLIDCFEVTACREEAAQFLDPCDEPQDQETANQIAGEMCDILQEIKARGLLSKLEPLLSNPVMTVRWRAAAGCLRSNEKEAVAALEYVVANGRFDEALPARETLDAWRDGRCLIDAL